MKILFINREDLEVIVVEFLIFFYLYDEKGICEKVRVVN